MSKEILKKIKPSELEEKETAAKVSEFLKILKSKKINAVAGGSFAKDTWISGNHDIDIFACFSKEKNMVKRLEKAVKNSFKKYEVVHGSRDYFIVKFKNLTFEIIPVLKIKKAEEAKNITDVSPLHVSWVRKNTSEKLRGEIRIAKQFFRANSCYGAETYIGGFSGYLVELLVIYYKSFSSLIKKTAQWKYGEVINFGKNNFVSQQRFPLMVIDPVQPNRNAAAALRKEVFDKFVELCKKFDGKDSWFEDKKIKLEKYDLVLKIAPLAGFSDVVGTKMLKAFEFIRRELDNDFVVKKAGWFWKDYGYFYFNLKNKTLSKYKEHFGPPVKLIEDCEKFKKKYKNHRINTLNGRLVVNLPRKFTRLNDFARYMLKNEYIKDKVKKIEILKAKAI